MEISASKIYRKVFKVPTSLLFKAYHSKSGKQKKISKHKDKRIRDFNSIPGPTPLPLIGNTWRYLPVIGEYDLERLHVNYQKMYEKYGEVVREVISGNEVIVHLFDPRDMEILYRNEGEYPRRISHRALYKYRLERPDIYNSGGLFPSNGEEWYRLRKAFQKHMLRPSAVYPYMGLLHDVCEDTVKIIKDSRNSKGEVNDLLQDLYKWATECTAVITLNKRLGSSEKETAGGDDIEILVKAAGDTNKAVMITENDLKLWRIYPTSAYRTLCKGQDNMANTVKKHLNTSIDHGKCDGETLLEKFMATPNIDEKDVFGMIMDLFLAGIDTTAYAAGYTLYHLANNQDCQEKVHRELKKVLPCKSSQITRSTINSLPYLKTCIKESLRLNPVALGTNRVFTNELVITNYRLPPKIKIVTQHQVACRQEKYFVDPLSFQPDRWCKNQLKDRHRHNPFLSLPFGYGKRMCMGRRFAEMELYLLLAKIFRNFRVEYHYGHMDCFTRLVNVPDKPLRFRFVDLEN